MESGGRGGGRLRGGGGGGVEGVTLNAAPGNDFVILSHTLQSAATEGPSEPTFTE